MSLVQWWPLRGDLTNLVDISNPLIATNTSVNTVTSDGKIGNTYTNTSNSSGSLVSQKAFLLPQTQSMFCWLYMTNVYSSSSLNAICGQHRHATNSGMGITIRYNNSTSGYLSVNTGNGSSRTYNYYYGSTLLSAGKWYHVGYTYDGSNIRLYVNGKLDGTHPYTGQKQYEEPFGAFMWSFNDGNIGDRTPYADYIMKGKLNDIRVYDHTLSDLEVKELSKGLVVHYAFNDTLAEPTTNLISNLHSLVNCTSYNNGVKIDWNTNSADTYFFIAPRETLISGDTYTISFWCDGVGNDNDVSFAISNLGDTHKFFIHDGYNEFTFTMNDTIAKGCFLDDINRVSGKIFTLINIQLEKKDHATPYTPNSRVSMICNETGYTSATSNDLSLTTTTNIGSFAGKFNGSTSCVDTPTIKTDMFTSDYTINFWVYPLDNDRAIYFGDYSTSNASNINFERLSGGALRYYHAGNPDKTFSNATTPINTWTMITITYTPENMKVYKNGTLIETYSHTATLTKNINSIMRIGRDSRSDYTALQGYISDFRFYVTTLTADDIKDLYQTKAMISDKGDIMCNQFVDGKNQAQVTTKAIFEAKEFRDEISSDYEQLEYIGFTRTQLIDTGVNFTSSTGLPIRIIADVTPASSSGTNCCLAGCGNSQWNGPVMLNLCNNRMEFGTNGYNAAGSYVPDVRTIFDSVIGQSQQTYMKDNEVFLNGTKTFITSNYNLYIGTFYTGSAASNTYYSGLLHSFKLYYGDISRIYIPVKRKSDGVLGLFEIVKKVFHQNVGSGTFTAGPVITNTSASIYETQNVSGRNLKEI